MNLPSIGRAVHYVSYGSPGGEFPSVCRAAVITEVSGRNIVSLAVLNPSGVFFDTDVPYSADSKGGTWHWPERT